MLQRPAWRVHHRKENPSTYLLSKLRSYVSNVRLVVLGGLALQRAQGCTLMGRGGCESTRQPGQRPWGAARGAVALRAVWVLPWHRYPWGTCLCAPSSATVMGCHANGPTAVTFVELLENSSRLARVNSNNCIHSFGNFFWSLFWLLHAFNICIYCKC